MGGSVRSRGKRSRSHRASRIKRSHRASRIKRSHRGKKVQSSYRSALTLQDSADAKNTDTTEQRKKFRRNFTFSVILSLSDENDDERKDLENLFDGNANIKMLSVSPSAFKSEYKEFPFRVKQLEGKIRSNQFYELRNPKFRITTLGTNVTKQRLNAVTAEYLENNIYDDYDGILRLLDANDEQTLGQVMMRMIYKDNGEQKYLQIQGILASPLRKDIAGVGTNIISLLKGILPEKNVRLLVNPIHQNRAWIDFLINANTTSLTHWIYTFKWIDGYNHTIEPFTEWP